MIDIGLRVVRADAVAVCVRCPWMSYLVAGTDEPGRVGDEFVCRDCGADIVLLPEPDVSEGVTRVAEPDFSAAQAGAMEAARNGLHLN